MHSLCDNLPWLTSEIDSCLFFYQSLRTSRPALILFVSNRTASVLAPFVPFLAAENRIRRKSVLCLLLRSVPCDSVPLYRLCLLASARSVVLV